MWRWLAYVTFGGLALAACSGSQAPITQPASEVTPSSSAASPVAVLADPDLMGLTECDSLWQSGDPVREPSPSSQFTNIGRDVRTLAQDLGDDLIVAWGSGQSVYGRLLVTVSRRDPMVLQAVREIDERYGDQDDICIEVPPVGYYDEPLQTLSWSVADVSMPLEDRWQSLMLVIEDDCGAVLRPYIRPPEVTYTDTEVQIVVTRDHVPWGLALQDACSPLGVVVLQLPEDPARRPLVDPGALPDNHDEPDPLPTLAPVPPGQELPADASTAVFLQQILTAAGFDHIVGEVPRSPEWSATASWKGERYDVTLFEREPSPLRTGMDMIDDCRSLTLHVSQDLPDDGRQALRRAAGCDDPVEALDLTVAYEECVHQAGMPTVQAQVFVDRDGMLIFLKTSPDVPGDIHGPCWESIGGAATTSSSHGR